MDMSSPLAESADAPLSRRGFLGRSVKYLSVAAAGTFLYTWRVEPHWVEVVERAMPIAGLPTSMVGKRLIQVSDLHAGPVVDQAFLKASLERIAELRPDAIVVTGDFMTCHGEESIAQTIDALQSLPAAPLGRFGILGNHDYGRRWSQSRVADALSRELERIDVRLLRNETASAGELQIAGIDEFWAGRHFQPELALRDLHTDRAAVALCHNPDGVDQPAWADFQGWILAGHTHGGQCRPPFLPPPLTPVENKRYTAGEFDLAPGRWMYINRGLGYSYRVRFNARPEITVFTLERA
jgi:predicted MPP superfamily phosphohydrolase